MNPGPKRKERIRARALPELNCLGDGSDLLWIAMRSGFAALISQPKISDEAYDSLVAELFSLDHKLNIPRSSTEKTLGVGHKKRDEFLAVDHSTPMLSLDNAFSFDELDLFFKKVTDFIKKTISVVFLKIGRRIRWR